jgi:hypothetical protein
VTSSADFAGAPDRCPARDHLGLSAPARAHAGRLDYGARADSDGFADGAGHRHADSDENAHGDHDGFADGDQHANSDADRHANSDAVALGHGYVFAVAFGDGQRRPGGQLRRYGRRRQVLVADILYSVRAYFTADRSQTWTRAAGNDRGHPQRCRSVRHIMHAQSRRPVIARHPAHLEHGS